MSNIHTVKWQDVKLTSPQAACAEAMREKRPFVLGLTFIPLVGDLLMFPDYFISYPVIRYAKADEIRTIGYRVNVVCQEPPEEITEKAEVGEGETVGAGGWPKDKWGYPR